MPLIKTTALPSRPLAEDPVASDIHVLAKQLRDANAELRRRAVRELLPFPEASRLLTAQLLLESDVTVRESILAALARIGDTTAVQGLVECLRSEDASLRNEAIVAMHSLPDEVARIMNSLLLDADADVRILALGILESLRHPHVEQWLIEVIDREQAVNVCGCAVDLLAEIGTAKSHAALARVKARFPDEPYIQFAATLALKRLDPS